MKRLSLALVLLITAVAVTYVASSAQARTAIAYWSANRLKAYYDLGYVGIGTNNPTSNLHVTEVQGGANLMTVDARGVRIEPPTTINNDLNVERNLGVKGNLDVSALNVVGWGRLGPVGDLDSPVGQHVAFFHNTEPGDTSDGIAIQIGTSAGTPTSSVNRFATFYNGDARVAGRIEGFSLTRGDPVPPPPLDPVDVADFIKLTLNPGTFFAGTFDFKKGTSAVFPVPAVTGWITNTPGSFTSLQKPSLTWPTLGQVFQNPLVQQVGADKFLTPKMRAYVCWAIDQGLEELITTDPFELLALAETLRQVTICKDGVDKGGGVSYMSTGADYAEWLRKEDPDAKFLPGQVVGVKGGRISRATEGADQVMSISMAPIVVGNMPPAGEEGAYEKVGFMGQVPVLVRGSVKEGDFIIPSGRGDGMGRAVSPGRLTVAQTRQVLGRSWEAADGPISMVNVVVGVKTNEWAEIFEAQEARIADLQARVDELEARAADATSLEARLAAIELRLGGPVAADPAPAVVEGYEP